MDWFKPVKLARLFLESLRRLRASPRRRASSAHTAWLRPACDTRHHYSIRDFRKDMLISIGKG